MDKQLVCDTTIAATNTEFDVSGKRDLNDEVDSYNNVINEKLRNGGAVFLLFISTIKDNRANILSEIIC